MAKSTGVNSTSPNTIQWAGADTDPFERSTDVAGPIENFDLHDHSNGKCLPVKRLQTSAAPTAAGEVRVNTDDLQWYGTALQTALRLGGSQTVTGSPTITGTLTLSGVTTTTTSVYVGDNSNANSTLGLTLNQGAADDEILAFKSSDVAHGMTALAETDTYGRVLKVAGADGGLYLEGLSDANLGAYLVARCATAPDTTKSGAGTAAVTLQASLKSGATAGAVGANGNLVAINNHSTTRFLLDAEGDLHLPGATTTDKIGNGTWYLNDTSNANQTTGLTLNQGAADDEILSFKSSDVAHGMTAFTETDTYGAVTKQSPGNVGGLAITGYGTSTSAFSVLAAVTTADTTKSTAAVAPLYLSGHLKSGTGTTTLGATNNIAVIATVGTARFVFQADGALYQSGRVYPGSDASAFQTACGISAGTGVPNNANGNNGDFYFRSDGGAGTCVYQRRAGAWVATAA